MSAWACLGVGLARASAVALVVASQVFASTGAQTSSPCLVSEANAYACLILTVAGSGAPDVGDDRPAVGATLESPWGVLAAADGSVYIADTLNDRLRRVTPDGLIHTVAGTGSAETQNLGDGLPAVQAQLRFPRAMAFGPDGSLYIADSNHYLIRRVTPDGVITTFAGNRNFVHSGEGIPATQASFATPAAVAADGQGNVYVADAGAHRIRRVGLDGIIHTVVGTGEPGSDGDGGPATQARITAPMSLAIDPQGGLLIGGTGTVRRVDLGTGVIASIAGANGRHLAVDSAGNLFFSSHNRVFRRGAVTGEITVIAGTGEVGFGGDGGPAVSAFLDFPAGLSVDGAGNVYVADVNNNRVRRMRTDGRIATVAGTGLVRGDDVPALQAVVYDSQGLAFDAYGNLFFTDFPHNTIRRLDRRGLVTTVAGDRRQTSSGDGGHPLQASFSQPRAIAFDRHGNLFVIDETYGMGTVRRISPGAGGVIGEAADEAIITVAGRSMPRDQADHGAADGGPATPAVFNAARGIAVDSRGNLYVADWLDDRVRKVVPGGDSVLNGGPEEIITTVVASPTISRPNWLAVDGADNLYILEERGVIRRLDATTGTVTTVAADLGPVSSFSADADGNLYVARGTQVLRVAAGSGDQTVVAGTGQPGYSGDGGDARAATFRGAGFVTIDRCGDLYVADNGNFRVRRVWLSPVANSIPLGLCTRRKVVGATQDRRTSPYSGPGLAMLAPAADRGDAPWDTGAD